MGGDDAEDRPETVQQLGKLIFTVDGLKALFSHTLGFIMWTTLGEETLIQTSDVLAACIETVLYRNCTL